MYRRIETRSSLICSTIMQTIIQKQYIPLPIEQVWDFFTSPENLNAITPDSMQFEIKSTLPPKVYEGLLIQYKVRPFLNIPFHWLTEITHVKELKFFVDEQRQGPYALWHHEHHFEEKDGGVWMTDILHYDIGKSVFGYIAGKLFVDQKVNQIFEYRKSKIDLLVAENRLK